MLETIFTYVSLARPIHLWLVFVIIIIYAGIMSVILIYHWQTFAPNNEAAKLAETVFGVVTGIILVCLAVVITIFSSQI
ncbi:MAG: hypothetical protein A2571_03660 [Candidatus Vogelbacteria bacterium RIFOXYD1_FULL_44_32]|uniref:Uncharacterized protein n=1 Tax=Candidatus Vogelbacteria bacterium RIFOXYD1_FULL_44_32 TaxID=1802438 RepID=A0A1G2QCE2_9BACT|nr:MAG: hypothetical protein A2571_03660 [Candidatus Vogelbacteria bacterium RIFOXYD1_FULL_44_32]